jgi:2-oxoglutarate dehydrogenase E2 component (dihydrolipoamide succinyltransferase)
MIEVVMPQLGESVAEGTVTQWHVKVGDRVSREQPLLEVATDKADSEVPSPVSGIVAQLVAKEGDVVATGGLLCTIEQTAAGDTARKAPPVEKDEKDEPPPATRAAPQSNPTLEVPAVRVGETPRTSPSTRKMAREQGIDLTSVQGTGERGRITRQDVQRAAHFTAPPVPPSGPPPSMPGPPPSVIGAFDGLPAQPSQARAINPPPDEVMALAQPHPGVGFKSYKVPPYVERPGDQLVPFSRRRRITADHMVYSQAVSPHVVTVAEIDLHATSRLRDKHKGAFEKEGVSLTFLAFVAAAVVKALRETPTLNARVLDDSYVLLKDINVGIAIDTPAGLLVANIKNADKLSLRGIAASVQDLAQRARDGKITADDLMGTTFTISNPGRKGNLFGAAIISQPNVGILRIGEIKKRPVVVTVDDEDQIAIHPVMYAALSYDHRIVDGVEANAFLWRIADVLGRGEFEIG